MQHDIRAYLAAQLNVETSAIEPESEKIADILRKRLTKKERKLLYAEMEEALTPELLAKIAPDAQKLEALRNGLFKKLHHPKIRNDLVAGS
jgi:hypothetical protein